MLSYLSRRGAPLPSRLCSEAAAAVERGVSCQLPDAAMATSACARKRAPADMGRSNGGVTADRAGAEEKQRGAAQRRAVLLADGGRVRWLVACLGVKPLLPKPAALCAVRV